MMGNRKGGPPPQRWGTRTGLRFMSPTAKAMGHPSIEQRRSTSVVSHKYDTVVGQASVPVTAGRDARPTSTEGCLFLRQYTRCVRQSDRLISLPLKAAHGVQLAAWELRTQRCPRLAAVELGEDPGWTSPSTREHVSGTNPDGILHVRRREPDPGVWDRRLACRIHLGRRESATPIRAHLFLFFTVRGDFGERFASRCR